MPPLPFDEIADCYRLRRPLGGGLKGALFLAIDEHEREPVAIRLLSPYAGGPPAERLLQALPMLAALGRGRLIQPVHGGIIERTTWYAMRYAEGGSLRTRLTGTPRPPGEALDWLRALAEGLDALHAQGGTHGEVEPESVLFVRGVPVLAEAWVEHLLLDGAEGMRVLPRRSPDCTAPEQMLANERTPAADRYALASIAWELLTGAPLAAAHGGMTAMVQAMWPGQARATMLPAETPGLTPAVCAVLARGLAVEPGARFESGHAFTTALGRALAGA